MKDHQNISRSCGRTQPNVRLVRDLATDKTKREMFGRLAQHLDQLPDEVSGPRGAERQARHREDLHLLLRLEASEPLTLGRQRRSQPANYPAGDAERQRSQDKVGPRAVRYDRMQQLPGESPDAHQRSGRMSSRDRNDNPAHVSSSRSASPACQRPRIKRSNVQRRSSAGATALFRAR